MTVPIVPSMGPRLQLKCPEKLCLGQCAPLCEAPTPSHPKNKGGSLKHGSRFRLESEAFCLWGQKFASPQPRKNKASAREEVPREKEALANPLLANSLPRTNLR